MESKTPQFDTALDKILADLVPHTRTCAECEQDFEIMEGDISLLRMLRVPPPTLCPACRNRRRLSFANYSNIYKRKCDVPGHSDTMISLVAPVVLWKTYDYETYYSDAWDPREYARPVKEGEPVLAQFLELLKVVPQPGVRRGSDSPGSDYSFYGKHMKDCYYVFGGRRSEDIMYSSSIYDSKHIVDSYFLREVEIGYENVTTSECYKCFFAYFSAQCIDCDFIYDCRNCQNCFGCVNLRNKQYCWFNEQFSKEEYQKKRSGVDLGKRQTFRTHQKEFWNLVKASPVRALRIFQSENVFGNDIKRSKNCYGVFQTEDSENTRYAYFAIMSMKDSMDMGFGGTSERLYEVQNVATNSSNVKFSYAVKESRDCEYVMTCKNCHDCFGCIGLQNASYCIFNMQYEPDKYFKKIDEMKSTMLEEGIYGEFFPMSFAPYPYNSSMAHIMYPMMEEEARERGLYWQEEKDVDISSLDILPEEKMPSSIDEVDSSILSRALVGTTSRKPYRILDREITFYKRYHLPLPTEAPYERIRERFHIMSNFRINTDTCFSCGTEIFSSHATADGYKPYCEACYQKEIL